MFDVCTCGCGCGCGQMLEAELQMFEVFRPNFWIRNYSTLTAGAQVVKEYLPPPADSNWILVCGPPPM